MSNAVMNPFDLRGWFRLASHVDEQRGNDEQIVMPAGYYAARQRRAIAVTRQRTLAGRRHHAARQRGALANGTQGPDQHPTLASNVVMNALAIARLVSTIVPRWQATR